MDRRRCRDARTPSDRHRAGPQRPADRDHDPGAVPEADTVTFPSTGSLQFICHLPGHEAYGMVGTVTITNGG